MSCSKFENDIALYAGDDLPAARIASVESHLAQCADCRALAEDLSASRALLGELRDQPLEDAMVAQVHRRVLAQLGRTGFTLSPRVYWKLALAAALLLAAVLMWPRHPAKQAPRARAVPIAAPQFAPPLPPASVIPVRHRVVRRRRRRLAAEPGPELLVQFVTDDPNIVIYWLVNQKPQGD